MNSDMFIGVLWMLLTTICFSLTFTVVRYIGTDMPATQLRLFDIFLARSCWHVSDYLLCDDY